MVCETEIKKIAVVGLGRNWSSLPPGFVTIVLNHNNVHTTLEVPIHLRIQTDDITRRHRVS